MTIQKFENIGGKVNETFLKMQATYGSMMNCVPPYILGKGAAAESMISRPMNNVNVQKDIEERVKSSVLTKADDTCGVVSNQVCDLFLGSEGAKKFSKQHYEFLNENGSNLKSKLSNKELLVRVEMDRLKPPSRYQKISKEKFDPKRAESNVVYLLEDKLIYKEGSGKVTDLEVNKKECRRLFETITDVNTKGGLYDELLDPIDGDEEEKAMCKITEYFDKKKNLFPNQWTSSHSFAIFIPKVDKNEDRKMFPYQGYSNKHTIQDWAKNGKWQTLSELGLDGYIDKLALVNTENDVKNRTKLYRELFYQGRDERIDQKNPPLKTSPYRTKFKVTEVDSNLALNNLKEIQSNINNAYPELPPEKQFERYTTESKAFMSRELINLNKQSITPLLTDSKFFKSNASAFFSEKSEEKSRKTVDPPPLTQTKTPKG